jgi:lysophospholipase L1-like esterase
MSISESWQARARSTARGLVPLSSWFLTLAPGLLGCAEGGAHYDPKTSASHRPDAGAAPGNAAGSGGTLPMAPRGSVADLENAFGVHFVGRVEGSSDEVYFAWSGSGFAARFSGTGLTAQLDEGQQYTVVVDGQVMPKFIPTGGVDTLVAGLAAGDHEVLLYRRTEANQGESVLFELTPIDGELLPPNSAPSRRLEIVGDSISCGYGNEGADMNCGFSPDTENHYLTYGALAARELGAELSTIAWSGKGVVCNYGDDPSSCIDPLPTYYGRALPNDTSSAWDFSSWQADAVVVNLGTNDFSTSSDPTQEEFETAYTALLARVRTAYPNAVVLCTVGPMLSGVELNTARAYIGGAVQRRIDAGDSKVKTFEFAPQESADGYGCDWHPSLRTHELMATRLSEVLRDELGW